MWQIMLADYWGVLLVLRQCCTPKIYCHPSSAIYRDISLYFWRLPKLVHVQLISIFPSRTSFGIQPNSAKWSHVTSTFLAQGPPKESRKDGEGECRAWITMLPCRLRGGPRSSKLFSHEMKCGPARNHPRKSSLGTWELRDRQVLRSEGWSSVQFGWQTALLKF